MRAAKLVSFGILLILLGAHLPGAIAGLLVTNSSTPDLTVTNGLGTDAFYVYLAQIVLMGLGLLIGLIGLFVPDPNPEPSAVRTLTMMQTQAHQSIPPLSHH